MFAPPPSPPLHVFPVYTLTRSPITAALYYLNVQSTVSRTLHFPPALLIAKVLALLGSLFTDPLFSLQSPSNARDKKKLKTAGDILTASVKG